MPAHSFLFMLPQIFCKQRNEGGQKWNSSSFRKTLMGTEVNIRLQMRVSILV